jgi:hypothetical protein
MIILQKLMIGMLFFTTIVFANESLNSIYENVILKNSQNAIEAIQIIKEDIQTNKNDKVKKDFSKLVISWKSVDAFYILGDLDDTYLDTPRYIDIFHQGNEDITKQLDLIISKKEDLSIGLYKNSHKTINALEYIIFTKDLGNSRVKNIALIIVDKIEENLQEIYDGYVEVKDKFAKNELAANAMMLNSLIENSYKLKEWRVGDPAGLSRKFEGQVSNDKGEYYISKNSIVAIKAILETHLMILEDQQFKNFGTMIKSYKVNEELNDAIKYLKEALVHTEDIQNDDFGNAKLLYEDLKKLHSTYYISLIGKLKVTAKILDADGD